MEDKIEIYQCSAFPIDKSYAKIKVIRDIIPGEEAFCYGYIKITIPAGSISWVSNESQISSIKTKSFESVHPEDNRLFANIPAYYFEVIEEINFVKTDKIKKYELNKSKKSKLLDTFVSKTKPIQFEIKSKNKSKQLINN